MKRFLLILSLIISLSAFAEPANNNVLTSGNGTATVETVLSGKPHLTIGYKNIFHAISIALPEARIEQVSENEETGEIIVSGNNGKNRFTERVIASRKDDAVIILLNIEPEANTKSKSKSKSDSALKLRLSAARKDNLTSRTNFTANGNNIEVHSTFTSPITDNEVQYYGFESVITVITDSGKETITNEEISLNKCSQTMIIISSQLMTTLATPLFEQLTQNNKDILSTAAPQELKAANPQGLYAALLQRHLEKYTAVLKGVSLRLNTGNELDRDIANLYNNLYYKSIRSGESLSIETDNFTALPKLTNLQKSQIRSSFLFDHYLYTLDTEFLETKVLPLMLTTYEDLEKTLRATDDFGFYIINKDDPTFDVAISIFFLRDFVTTCNILAQQGSQAGFEQQQKVPRLQEILAKLPPYKIDINEEFRRHLLGESANENKYSDVPQLYGLFYRNDPIITRNYDIREACKTTIQTCLDYRTSNSIKGIDQGFLQLAISSAALGEGNTSYRLISEARAHWDKASGRELVPIIKKMLAQSYYSPESSRCYLNILPAIPDEWHSGELAGMPIRGGITMTELKWTKEGDVTASMLSKTDISVDIYIRGQFIKTIDLTANEPYNLHAKKKE